MASSSKLLMAIIKGD
ncbi:uncharacterized protein FFE2_16032 [Fusarium fujikuroi]|nr:uncharacterized protein FFE2_16032 [Fusarium fujikuroi]